MRLFLVRHGETVDNVAGLYAGSRDSALTNTGVQQARRLGEFLSINRPQLTHVFASPLQRAHKTALAVCAAQNIPAVASVRSSAKSDAPPSEHLSIVKVADLVEQDFGFYEGKPFYARPRDSSKTGREAHYDAHKSEPGFVDVESKVSLAQRCDNFLDHHLLPLFEHDKCSDSEHVVVIVSHGILLSNLWRRLLLRLPCRSVVVVPEILASKGQVVLEHLGGWSNTGFLELTIRAAQGSNSTTTPTKASTRDDGPLQINAAPAEYQDAPLPASNAKANVDHTSPLPAYQSGEVGDVEVNEDKSAPVQKPLDGYLTTVLTIDGKEHLKGFKRTRGGIGRAEHDEKQKTMDSFFKRAKKE